MYYIEPDGKSATFKDCDNLRKHVTVKKYYKGVPVTKIEDRAFRRCILLDSVTLPDTIEYIGHSAFESTLIKKIIIPPKVSFLGNHCFNECYLLRDVIFQKGSVLETIPQKCFSENVRLLNINIPDSIRVISAAAFAQCKSLQTISLPDSIRTIEDFAFESCPLNLKKLPTDLEKFYPEAFEGNDRIHVLYLSKNVKCMTEGFYSLKNLESIEVHPDNPKYYAIDGVLYNRKKKSLAAYPPAKKDTLFNVPPGVKQISNNCFTNTKYLEEIVFPSNNKIKLTPECFSSSSLKRIVLPDNIDTIPRGCFEQSKFLKTISLPKKLKTIESSAFHGCISLQSIELPLNLETLGECSFYGTNISEFNIPVGVIELKDFCNHIPSKNKILLILNSCDVAFHTTFLDYEISIQLNKGNKKNLLQVGNNKETLKNIEIIYPKSLTYRKIDSDSFRESLDL